MTDTIRTLLERGASALPGPAGRLEAELLLAHLLDKPRSHLFAWPERQITAATARRFLSLLARRAGGEPVAYLTGEREFWSLPLRVNPTVLIPRPETELLVELALSLAPATACTVADLGTGSGAIALAIASERPAWRVIATDRSGGALATAQANATALGLTQIVFRRGEWCSALPPGRFDLIIANPPYVAAGDPHLRQGDLRFEPADALRSGSDGLDDIRLLVRQTRAHLTTGGWLLLEHGCDQGEAVRALYRAAGYGQVTTHRDLAGLPRATLGMVDTTEN